MSNYLAWAVIPLVLMMVAAPIFCILPTSRDKYLTALRLRAKNAGCLVKMASLDKLDANESELVRSSGRFVQPKYQLMSYARLIQSKVDFHHSFLFRRISDRIPQSISRLSKDWGLVMETTQINGTPYGYASGGNYPMISSVDRVDYSNDTATASVKGPISRNKYYHGATGNLSYGYHGGGEYPDTSYMDRIDYSNDSATSSPKGNLSYSKYGQAVAGNLSYGYWMGGTPGAVSTISRVDYADDTSTALSKGNLDSVRRRAAATGNASYAYCGAGQGSPGSPISTVDRIDYSNDTATAVAKGPLSGEKAPLGSALGTTSYGYFLSGNPVDPFGTIIDRIDYSNDTATASPKGNLAVAKYAGACFSSPSYGYYGGCLL